MSIHAPITAEIAGRTIGDGAPCFIIAEIGVNHNGNMDLARRLIDEAATAGADAAKFQAYVTEELITPKAHKAAYQVQSTGPADSQFQMLKNLELSGEQQAELKDYCATKNIIYTCTPYDLPSLDLLDQLDVPLLKIASTDTTNLPFLKRVAESSRPVILSTGMCTLSEVEAAITAMDKVRSKLSLLHCTSEYPAPPDEANLRAIETLRYAFRRPTGYSDHSAGVGISPWAVAAGASIIEKHLTLERTLPGPDHQASIEPRELAELVRTIRGLEKSLGDGVKRPSPSEAANKDAMRKSVVAKRPLQAGAIITGDDLACKRPGSGLAPEWVDRLIGKQVNRDIAADTILALGDFHWR